MDAHEVTIEEKSACIEFDALPEIPGVPFQITQLFDNLIGNALKYSHEQRAPHIVIRHESIPGAALDIDDADVHTPYYKITLTDNGIGFKTEHATQDLQSIPSSARKIRISGLGYWTCHLQKDCAKPPGLYPGNRPH